MSINLNWATRMVIDSLRGKNLKVALLDGFGQQADQQVWTDVQTWEVAGSGYTPGGLVAVVDVIPDPDANAVNVTCAPIPFGLLGVPSANAVVFYDDTGNPDTSRIFCSDEFVDGGLAIDGTSFTYLPPEGGLLTLSIADDS